MRLEIFFTVIVRKLFTRPDCAEREDVYSMFADPDLAIRSTGVVDEASGIRRDVSVDQALVTRPEEVLPAILLDLFGGGGATMIFDDERTLGYALLSEKSPATVRPMDC